MSYSQNTVVEKVAESLKAFITLELMVKSTDLLLTNSEISKYFDPNELKIDKIKGCFLVVGEDETSFQLKIKPISELHASFPKMTVFNLRNKLSRKKIICIIDFNSYPDDKEFIGRIFIGDSFEEYIRLNVIEKEEKDRWKNWVEEIIKK